MLVQYIFSLSHESPYFLARENRTCYFIVNSSISSAQCVLYNQQIIPTSNFTSLLAVQLNLLQQFNNIQYSKVLVHPPVPFKNSLYVYSNNCTVQISVGVTKIIQRNVYPFKLNGQLYFCDGETAYNFTKAVGQCSDIRKMSRLDTQDREQIIIGKYIATFYADKVEIFNVLKKRTVFEAHAGPEVTRQILRMRTYDDVFYVDNNVIYPIELKLRQITGQKNVFRTKIVIYVFYGIVFISSQLL
ncbi:Hypothetical_protein [Hexamita inflata]|uniref:Hypothetical_protein n=1 Tax=Hexamita inflata TaxID=28002 RepID=A0AA86NRU7_9EUKA|nr:Hypothetical protein HINF_LOCUS11315 [Hexamita inflata]